MSTVQIVVNPKSGSIITAYKSNPEFGYVQLQQSAITIASDGWIREQKRTCLLRAEVAVLKSYVNSSKQLQVPGKIVVREYVESELPESMRSLLNKNVPYEEAIASFVKRAGADGNELTLGGERILRFASYDPTDTQADITVQHDNVAVPAKAVKTAAVTEADL